MKKPAKKPAPEPRKTPVPMVAVTPAAYRPPIRLYAVIVAALAFLLYANTLSHEYTVDDGTVIENNTITKKGISAIPEIFSSAYRAGFWERKEGLYRPLSVAMFAVEYALAPGNPAPGHWINVLLYALTAALLFVFLATLLKKYSVLLPLTATLLFVFHPLHTEVVANIKSRDELLTFLFGLLTLYGYLLFLRRKSPWLMVASALGFFLALLSKESAVTLLPILPLMAWFFAGTKLKSSLMHLFTFAGVTAVYLFIRMQVLGSLTGSAELQLINNSILGASTFADRLATAFAVMGRYLVLLFIPHPLAFDYSYNQIPVVSWSSASAFLPLLACCGLAWLGIRGMKTKNPAAFGIWFFFIAFSLVSNLFFLIESTMAERFLYAPSLGFALAVAFALVRSAKLETPGSIRSGKDLYAAKPAFTMILSAVLLLFAFKTINRNSDWKDNLTLLSQDVKTCPQSARIRYAYGSALLIEKALKEENPAAKTGYLDRSIAELEKGVSILPNYAEAWKNLGLAYKEKEQYPQAMAAFEKARSYKKFTDVDFYVASGLAYGMSKKYDQALADFDEAIRIDPKNAEAYNNKGLYLTEMGKIDSALTYLDNAIRLKPEFYQAYYNKGNTLAQKQDFNGAIKQYEEALRVKPDYVDAWLNMGNSYAAMKRFAEALPYFQKVDSVQPNNFKAIVNLGITYRMLGDTVTGNRYFEQARKLQGTK